MDFDGRVLIIGAGPCGLACALELERMGHRKWTIAEKENHPGGHASSVVDSQGFTWDLGGHVVFSHFGEFDRLLDEVMGDDLLSHERSSYVRFGDRWVPYPFQNNLRYLPSEIAYECVTGLIDAPGGDPGMDFATWMRATFGDGITRHFMEPYNVKVWASPTEKMSSNWIAERVSVVDYRRALRSLIFEEDDLGWGPNNKFSFPAEGGTGEIYRRLALDLGERICYDRQLVEIDAATQTVRFADGSSEAYDALVSTMPIDLLVGRIVGSPDEVRRASKELEHNGVYMVGIGYEKPLADDKSWMYFPQNHAPFYRATNFAKYSPANVPGRETNRYCSYMTETAFSSHKPESLEGLEERVQTGLNASGVIEEAKVISVHIEKIEYAYPIPTLGRDRALDLIQPWLMSQGIYSRGRFGSWRYEIGNMDHAVKMGVDVARLLLKGEPEELWSS